MNDRIELIDDSSFRSTVNEQVNLLRDAKNLSSDSSKPNMASNFFSSVDLSKLIHKQVATVQKLQNVAETPMYVDIDLDHETCSNKYNQIIHWYYGDSAKRLKVFRLQNHLRKRPDLDEKLQMKHLVKDDYPNQEAPQDGFFRRIWKANWTLNMRKCFAKDSSQKTAKEGIDIGHAAIDRFEKISFYIKLIICIVVFGYYQGRIFGIFDKDEVCKQNYSQQNYYCIHESQKCADLINNPKKHNGLVFYCTEADFKAKNQNFCLEGYCSSGEDPCEDHYLYKRIDAFSKRYKDCLFQKNKGKKCTKAQNNNKEEFIDCSLGIELYLFVFIFSKIITEK